MGKSITIKQLKREAALERWDQPAIPEGTIVKGRDKAGNEFCITGFADDRDSLVLIIEPVEADYGDYDLEQPEPVDDVDVEQGYLQTDR